MSDNVAVVAAVVLLYVFVKDILLKSRLCKFIHAKFVACEVKDLLPCHVRRY
jgi:hypothetical protein